MQVGGRAVGAEGEREVREVRERAFSEAGAGVSGWDAGAICTLELGVLDAGWGGGGQEGEEEQGGVGKGREHPEERITVFSMSLSYLYSLSLQMSDLVTDQGVQLDQTEGATGP